MSIFQHVLFLACVALATYAQTMTGFAFGLVLLGLSGVFQLASVSDVANVVSVLSLVNAVVTLARAKPQVNWRLMAPALASSLVGVGAGGGRAGVDQRVHGGAAAIAAGRHHHGLCRAAGGAHPAA